MAKLRFKVTIITERIDNSKELGAFYTACNTDRGNNGRVVQLTEFLQWVADRLAYQQSTGEVGEAPINGKLYGRQEWHMQEVLTLKTELL